MHATLAVVALLQANLDMLHLRTATDSHITTSRAPWAEHVLVVPAINRIGLVDRSTLRLVYGNAKRWTPVAVKVTGCHLNQCARSIECNDELVLSVMIKLYRDDRAARGSGKGPAPEETRPCRTFFGCVKNHENHPVFECA